MATFNRDRSVSIDKLLERNKELDGALRELLRLCDIEVYLCSDEFYAVMERSREMLKGDQ